MEPGQDAAVDQEEVLQLLLDAPGGGGVVAPGAHVPIVRVARGAVNLGKEDPVAAENRCRYGDASLSWLMADTILKIGKWKLELQFSISNIQLPVPIPALLILSYCKAFSTRNHEPVPH
jgi:hypothetical protein